MIKKDYDENRIKFVNHIVIDHELLDKIIYDVGKVTRSGHLAPAYLDEINKIRAYLFFIYGVKPLYCMLSVFLIF